MLSQLFKLHTFPFALDSSSDWGQGIYAAPSQGSDTISEGMGDEGEASTDLLPKKIKVQQRDGFYFINK